MLILMINVCGITCEIVQRWMSLDPTNEKSALVQVMAWCHQATNNYLSNVEPDLCRHMSSLGHNELNISEKLYYKKW